MKINCLQCGKEKDVRKSDILRGKGKFCSRKCSSIYNGNKRRKYKIVQTSCPVCETIFTTNEKENKTTCSSACANTHFRTGTDHASYKNGTSNPRTAAFLAYGHKCLICDEDKVLDIHHLDENHSNNDIKNTVPLCPTHHAYMHRGYKDKYYALIANVVKALD